ncbi:hypothetical protein BDV06DRAFT_217579 [Aspergillus oleicola]
MEMVWRFQLEMRNRILDRSALEGLPEAPTSVPAWGTLPLDIYLLEQWETFHQDSDLLNVESPDQRRKRLVRLWLNLGTMGRDYNSLRRYAAGYQFWTGNEGMWIRTCYDDAETDEAHTALCDEYVEISQTVGADSLVLEDKALFEYAGVGRIFDLSPERVANYCAPEEVIWREKQLAEYLQTVREAGDEEEVFGPEERGLRLSPESICGKYWTYHAACVVTHIFIEDAVAQCKGRVDSDQVDNFDGAWANGHWKEGWSEVGDGELGKAYLQGV